jgi:hypothetical protein
MSQIALFYDQFNIYNLIAVILLLSEISGSHSGVFIDQYFLGCCASLYDDSFSVTKANPIVSNERMMR